MTVRAKLGGLGAGRAIVAAVLAACGGAVEAMSAGLDDAGAPGGDAGASPQVDPGTAEPSPSSELADARRPADAGRCPPADAAYWDEVLQQTYDGGICGVPAKGTVTGDVYCTFLARHQTFGEGRCVPAVCNGCYMAAFVPSSVRLPDGGYVAALDEAGVCTLPPDDVFPVSCSAGGRRPSDFRARPVAARDAAGAWLATQATLEAASVPAFRELAVELEAHGAPRELVASCLAAARDEVRHAEVVGALASRHGGRPLAPSPLRALAPRPLVDLARDNAVEGLVRETFAAAVAVHQGLRAPDAATRQTFARIARDEIRHAELSRAIDDWASSRLADAERASVREAARAAIATLATELEGLEALDEASPEWHVALGLPDRSARLRLLRELDAHAWSHELAA